MPARQIGHTNHSFSSLSPASIFLLALGTLHLLFLGGCQDCRGDRETEVFDEPLQLVVDHELEDLFKILLTSYRERPDAPSITLMATDRFHRRQLFLGDPPLDVAVILGHKELDDILESITLQQAPVEIAYDQILLVTRKDDPLTITHPLHLLQPALLGPAFARPDTPSGELVNSLLSKWKLDKRLENKGIRTASSADALKALFEKKAGAAFVLGSDVYRTSGLSIRLKIQQRRTNHLPLTVVIPADSPHAKAAKHLLVFLQSPAIQKAFNQLGYHSPAELGGTRVDYTRAIKKPKTPPVKPKPVKK